jgi:hypothetical protein
MQTDPTGLSPGGEGIILFSLNIVGYVFPGEDVFAKLYVST